MIYATEQQVVVTAVLIVVVAFVALFIGIWYGVGRGREEGEADAREQAKARRTHPAYRPNGGNNISPPPKPGEIAHEKRLAPEEMFPWAGSANTATAPTAITTGEIQAITDEMDTWLAQHVYSAPTDYGAWLERQVGDASG